jgi:hypothetical protein
MICTVKYTHTYALGMGFKLVENRKELKDGEKGEKEGTQRKEET